MAEAHGMAGRRGLVIFLPSLPFSDSHSSPAFSLFLLSRALSVCPSLFPWNAEGEGEEEEEEGWLKVRKEARRRRRRLQRKFGRRGGGREKIDANLEHVRLPPLLFRAFFNCAAPILGAFSPTLRLFFSNNACLRWHKGPLKSADI